MAQQQGHTVLNDFPRDQFNVLIPVQSLQAISAMQKIVINRVELDTRIGPKKVRTKNGDIMKDLPIGNDIYQERNGEYAITKVGGMKLAAAANISIVKTEKIMPDSCVRCSEIAAATKVAPSCGSCASRFNSAYTVTIRVPELSGGFRLISGTKEIDVELEKGRMTEFQFKEYLPNAAAQAESKAFMRALRMALGLQGTYPYEEIQKPFIVAHVVPDLDNPVIQQMAAQNMLQSMGMLYETTEPVGISAPPQQLPAAEDMPPKQAQLPPAQDPVVRDNPDAGDPLPEYLQEPQIPICSACSSMIQGSGNWTPEAIEGYSKKRFGRALCVACQRDLTGGANK